MKTCVGSGRSEEFTGNWEGHVLGIINQLLILSYREGTKWHTSLSSTSIRKNKTWGWGSISLTIE